MKKFLIPLSILIITSMAYADVKDRFRELDKIADQSEVQKNIKSKPQTSDGRSIDTQIKQKTAKPLARNFQNSGQDFTQGPTGFKENRITPQTNTSSPLLNPNGVPQGNSLQQQKNDNNYYN